MRKKLIILFLMFITVFLLITSCMYAGSGIRPVHLKCDYRENPTGIGRIPSFCWELFSDERSQAQTAYQIIIADDEKKINDHIGNTWNSGKVFSSESVHIRISGVSLQAGTEYFWRVKVWDRNGTVSDWSDPAAFVTALFDTSDWKGARWISYEKMQDSLLLVPGIETWDRNVKLIARKRPIVPLFRADFKVRRRIRSAYLFACGLGHYTASINGKPVSNDFLSPGWTHYRKTCLYNTCDVTSLLKIGNNSIGFIVGNGFHNINNERYRKLLITYGVPRMIACLRINYADGTSDVLVSDDSWKTTGSPVTYTSIFGGENYDARLEQKGWDRPGFDDRDWAGAVIADPPGGRLVPETTYPVKIMEVFDPIDIVRYGTDTFLYDFGQNASGVFEMKIKGRRGDTIRFWPGELIDENGRVTQYATGRPHYYEYILNGEEVETWQPRFTYYGFRYIQVEGARASGYDSESIKPELLGLRMLHMHNSAPRTGGFSCSNPLFNQIDTLIRYAIQSNFQSVITDCPHREKLGWLEQSYLMGESIQYNYEVFHLYRKLIHDMMDAQHENGLIGNIAPEYVVFDGDFADSPEWGSAIVMLPWMLYKWYGDLSVMEEAWPAMVRYVRYLDSRQHDNILSYGLGDWYDMGPERPGFVQLTPKASTATAIYYYDYKMLFEMALLLKKKEDAYSFHQKAREIKRAYNKLLFDAQTSVYASGSQTAMAVPLAMGLAYERHLSLVTRNLADSIRAKNKAITAGDIGFHYLVEALAKNGEDQLLYDMTNRDDVPGYGYQIRQGATALTESWQALRNVSNNHLMLGHVMEWFYAGLGGISQEENSGACKMMIIKPAMVKGMDEAKACYHTPYGWVKSEWQNAANAYVMKIEIPVNTTATVYLPVTDISRILEGDHSLKELPKIKILGTEQNQLKIKIGSGTYNFIIVK